MAPSILHNTITKNLYYKILSGLIAEKVTNYTITSNFFSKYEEFRADKGIPNKKKFLIPVIEELENDHQQTILPFITSAKNISFSEFFTCLLTREDEQKEIISALQVCCIRYLPSSFYNNGPLMTILYSGKLPHPASIHRANLFRARLEEIEKAESAQ